MGVPMRGGSSILAARLAHPVTDAQGHTRTAMRRASPTGRPLRPGGSAAVWHPEDRLGRRRSGPPSSRAGRLPSPPPVGLRPVGSDAPERPPRPGRCFHFLHVGPSGESLQLGPPAIGQCPVAVSKNGLAQGSYHPYSSLSLSVGIPIANTCDCHRHEVLVSL